MSDEPPRQPQLSSTNNYSNIRPIQEHRTAVIEYAKTHEGEWVTYWDSESKVSARSTKRSMRRRLVGDYVDTDPQYVQHGQNGHEGWSIRLVGNQTQIRFNGPWWVGIPVNPDRRLKSWHDDSGPATLPE